MSDLIRREDVIEALKLLTDEDDPYDEGYNLGLNTAILEVKKRIPSAEPNVGRWIEEYNGNGWNDYWDYTCSVCGKKYERADILYKANYCPNCGAKMKAE